MVNEKTIFDRPTQNLREVDDEECASSYLFASCGEPIGKVEITNLNDAFWAQAHHHVLLHHKAFETL